jgi:dTDP-4-dehydrorhamnose 3,5-epimerase-like enzyme
MNIRKLTHYDVRADGRGSFRGVITGMDSWREINLFHTKAGMRRGGHYAETSIEMVFLLKGRVEVILCDVKNPSDIVRLTLRPGEGVVIPPFVCRTFVYAEDGEAIACRDIPHHETGPDVPFDVPPLPVAAT